jgi:hypothetical protein
MGLTIPARTLAMRWNAIACALTIFVWSTPEDDRVAPAVALGMWLALTVMSSWVAGRFAGRTLRGARLGAALAVFGSVTGAAVSISTVLLMVFKDARHAHMYPDFPPTLLGGILLRLPAWTVAGGFAGLGVALVLMALSRRAANRTSSRRQPVL